MNKKTKSSRVGRNILVLLAVAVCICGRAAFGQPWDGNGVEGDPYLIWDANQLNAIGANPSYWGGHFKLMVDIDLGGYTGTEFNIIGRFTGVFDGKEHTISNFTWDYTKGSDNVGLFRKAGQYWGQTRYAEIKNLTLIDPNVNAGTGSLVGSLVGCLEAGSVISCGVSGGRVSGGDQVGGLIGSTFPAGHVSRCYADVSVSGVYEVGGLVGENWNGTISYCCSSGGVTGYKWLGGLVGESGGTIFDCYAQGSVAGSEWVAGLAGFISSWKGTISRCYSSGSVVGNSGIGGFLARNYGKVSDSFWDIQTSGQTTSAGGRGLTTAEMQTESTFTDDGWDFNTPIWTIDDGNDYPRLWWEVELDNAVPVACIVGGDRVVEAGSGCEGRVVLDGSCSSDEDSTAGTNDDINDFDWYDVIDVCDANSDIWVGSGEVIECNLGFGEHLIILEVTDKTGAFDSNEVVITVEDVTPPEFSLSVEPNVLWPPNNKMVLVTPGWEVSDNCDESPEVSLVDITMSAEGDVNDYVQIDGDGSISLRAKKGRGGAMRMYTLTYEAVDDSGNAAIDSATVAVRHDRR